MHGINSTVLFEAELFGIETIIEGDCLLTRHANHKAEMLAAIILWQFDVSLMDYSLEKIAARSYLRLMNIWLARVDCIALCYRAVAMAFFLFTHKVFCTIR